MSTIRESFAAGYACLVVWADLLDRINVFPVADQDTGTNLRISMAPLRDCEATAEITIDLLGRCATGNSGNIAAAFFREFCRADSFHDLTVNAAVGRDKAWQAVAKPCAGTMLTVFDRLAAVLESHPEMAGLYPLLCSELNRSVLETSHLLPDLREAGVVDSGALAMYIFFDGFFNQLTEQTDAPGSIPELFDGTLTVKSSFCPDPTDSYCVDAVIQPEIGQSLIKERIAELGESVVVVADADCLKIHIHTPNPLQLRTQLDTLGRIVDWEDEAIDQSGIAQFPGSGKKQPIHIMTDAAGSLTREMAGYHSITLMDSYIIADGDSGPESLYAPERLYSLMRKGRKVTTAQASLFERHQHYRNICGRFGATLYLCVGSAFTGNFATAMAWKEKHDPDNLLQVMDTGAASGRLALLALLTARHAERVDSPQEVIDFARKTGAECEEFVFIDELKYLAAGGRVSKASGFFGDALHLKPVVSPCSDGVRKLGVVRSRKGQLDFALKKLRRRFRQTDAPVIMLQYTDNKEWITGLVLPQVQELLPQAEVLLTPLSLTSGVHMGPGTWSMAIAPA